VRSLRPDIPALETLDARGVIVTAAADAGTADPAGGPSVDFVSRFFAPRVGVPEDPVTGSAHTVLGPFWAERLGRDDLIGAQLSARGGRLGVRVRGERVLLSGQAVTVLDGFLSASAQPPSDSAALPFVGGHR
jgi:predicted PhzF superfamily epimerase YddE/YHI9